MNNNGAVPYWKVVAGQLPWVITMATLGIWFASKYDSRMAAVEAWRTTMETWKTSVETEQRAEQSRQMDEMKRTIEDQTDELKRLRGAVNAR